MKRTATLRARSGTYRDKQTGQEKTGYVTAGHILQGDDGRTMYKLDSIPVEFDGWLFPGDLPTKGVGDSLTGKDAAAEQTNKIDDDIPF